MIRTIHFPSFIVRRISYTYINLYLKSGLMKKDEKFQFFLLSRGVNPGTTLIVRHKPQANKKAQLEGQLNLVARQ